MQIVKLLKWGYVGTLISSVARTLGKTGALWGICKEEIIKNRLTVIAKVSNSYFNGNNNMNDMVKSNLAYMLNWSKIAYCWLFFKFGVFFCFFCIAENEQILKLHKSRYFRTLLALLIQTYWPFWYTPVGLFGATLSSENIYRKTDISGGKLVIHLLTQYITKGKKEF